MFTCDFSIYRNGDEFTRAIHVYLTPIQMQEMEIILRTVGERVVLQDNRAIRRLELIQCLLDLLHSFKLWLANTFRRFVHLPIAFSTNRLFAMDGRQILDADEVEDGQPYVACGQENMHQCQYGHTLPRLQVGTARKKPKHHGVHYLHDLPDDLNDRVCEQLSHHTPRCVPATST
ncbi:hypothetical protein Ciccas_005069 [Cichlidogyrus casuarinus]|uniref:Doublecortin domain-containing protein n=1 Tax=Cichlidogyrus casuarinus TaxID=1844966 RepID=A0ABD2QA50_9PLAT